MFKRIKRTLKIKRLILFSFIVLVLFTIIYSIHNLIRQEQRLAYRHKVNNSTKFILLWTAEHYSAEWFMEWDGLAMGPNFFKRHNCKVYNCLMTNDRGFLTSHDQYAAILFHPINKYRGLPTNRTPDQYYVFASAESPISYKNTRMYDDVTENFFNLTMTYSRFTDIFWPYNYFLDMNNNVVAPLQYGVEPKFKKMPENITYDPIIYEHVRSKRKDAAWFVSHCRSESRRDELVKALQEFIVVDIYGDCGSKSCPHGQKCFEMLEQKYYFYLSFENTFCEDYISEKMFDYMKYDIVPVVYGGADYSKFAPPHSYIDANKFDSPGDLATYLNHLIDNEDEYMEYFWWKKYYKVATPFPDNTLNFPLCDLCAKVHEPVIEHKTYSTLWKIIDYCDKGKKIKF